MSVDVNDIDGGRVKWSSYQKYVLALLVLVYVCNYIDRQIIAILSPAIKEDLGLTDTQLGLLKGFAFALFYGLFGFGIARLADRKSRVNIISACLALWSGMTVLCGVAQNFSQLLLARMGVGIGEAGCNPPAHSLISDYFPKKERATALGFYSLGISFGSLFGILLGGVLAATFGWRWAFVIVGVPGILLALIVKATLREPKRGGMEFIRASADVSKGMAAASAEPMPEFAKSFEILWKIKSYKILCISAGLTAFCGYAFALWMVDFLVRTHELTYAQLTLPLAFVIGIGGGIGTVAGGYITDYFGRKDESLYFMIPAWIHIVSVPFFLMALWIGSPTLVFVFWFFMFMLHNAVAGPYYGLIQNLSPLKLRAFGAALFFFILSMIGVGLGPFYIGALSDFLIPRFGDADALRWALTTLAPIWVIAAIIMLRARRDLPADLENTGVESLADN